MERSGIIMLLTGLCLTLTGCSAGGGIACGALVVLALGILLLAVSRGQSLARLRRSRRLNKRQRAWLRAQMQLTNAMYILALVLALIGVIVGLASGGGEDTPTEVPTLSDTVPPTEGSTDPSGSGEETVPDLIGIPESLLELMENNPETKDFVLNYPDRQPMEIDLSGIDRSAGVPLFMQWDPRWGYETYGSDVLAITGCAPTCLAMVGYYLTGDGRFTPDQLAEFSEQQGYYAYGNGTKWTFIGEGAEKLGLVSTELPLAEGVLIRHLQAGHPVIAVMGPGDFTTTGHYVVLVGYEDGMFQINDPNRRANSERLWSYETLEPQIRNLWAIEAGAN